MTVTSSPSYGTAAALTITLASLASDTNVLAGRASTAIDNTADLAIDATVGGKVKTGATTANTRIEIWAYGQYDATTYTNAVTGTDAGFTAVSQQKGLFKLLQIIFVPDTTARTYTWGPCSVANAFGGVMPQKWGVFVVHNTGANLNSTGSTQEVRYTPIKYTSG